MQAIVIGATGATGKHLVDELLKEPAYSKVIIFVRKNTEKHHPKLEEHVIDFSKIDDYKDLIKGDVLFSCLGTTLKIAGSKDNQWKVDYEIPLAFATIARENGVNACVLLSAAGASAKSNIFYNRMKGELEDAIESLKFDQYIIFRPGILERENSDRTVEIIGVKLIKFLNKAGILKKQQPLPTSVLAEKLSKAPLIIKDKKRIIELEKIRTF